MSMHADRITSVPRSISLPQCTHSPAPYTGPTRDEVMALRHQYLVPGILTMYRDPLLIAEGHMQYVWDETGQRYLDGYGGIVSVSVGHCHPKVTAAVQAQLAKLHHTTIIYLHPTIGQFAQLLAAHFPADSGLSTTCFTNSGSEANEVATLYAREFTGNADIISLRNGYHGGTSATMGLTAHSNWKFKSNNSVNNKFATPGYCYRCPFGLTYPSCNVKCATDAKRVIEYETSGKVAAFIGEPIQGYGGVIVPPKEYFQITYDIVRQHGGLCIADEVQTGFGRTGAHFWGFQNYGVIPDMVTMAKGIGNGFPLGACTMRRDISAVTTRKIHFNTFAGNPIAMAQGLATLQVIDEENLQVNAARVGTHLKNRLQELAAKHPIIGDIRGLGLMLGIELVRDRGTKEPATTQTTEILERCKQRHLLLGKGGLYGNVIRIKPPLCITKDDADYMVDCLDEVL